MPAIHVTTEGGSGRLGAAALPVPAANFMSWQSWGPVVGMPSRSHIAAPAPVPGTDRTSVAQSMTGIIGEPSSDFSSWNPGIYYQPRPPACSGGEAGANMATASDNQMPVPAKNPNGSYSILARRPVFLRNQQVGQPVVTPLYRWRS
jgi:hypothetical protein